MMRASLFAIVWLLLCGLSSAPGADEKAVEFTARVTATEKGQIEKITLRGDGIEKELDLKTEVAAYTKKLVELAAKHKDKAIKLTIEIDPKLLQAHVVQLVDQAVRAGFKDVSPVPLEKPKR